MDIKQLNEELDKLLETFNMKDRYHEYKGFWFTNDTTDEKFKEFIVNAYNNHSRVMIVYKPGWEDFSGYHGGDGLHHSMYIGSSSGQYKVPLEIKNNRSSGGSQLLTCDKAIDSYKVIHY